MPKYHYKKFLHKKSYHPIKWSSLLRFVVIVLAFICSVLAVIGLISYISPTMFLNLLDVLPSGIKDTIITDMFLRGGSGFWVFLILSVAFWYIGLAVLKRR